MSYASNEEFFWERLPNTSPIPKVTSDIFRQELTKEVAEGSASSHSPNFTSSMHGEKKMSSPFDLNTFISDLGSSSAEKRIEVIRAIERAGRGTCFEARFYLQEALKDPSEEVRLAAIEVLGTLEEYAPVEALLDALTDSYWDVRAAAAQALGNQGGQASIKHLVAMLRQERDESVREAIVRALGRQGKSMPVEILVWLLHHEPNWLVREAAAWALGELGEEAPVQSLINALRSDSDESVRAAAARSLGQAGAQEAESLLFKVLENSDEEVQEAANWALQQLDEQTRGKRHWGTVYQLDGSLSSFFEKLFPCVSSPEGKQAQRKQLFCALTQFISDKKGCVWKADLRDTNQGKVLVIDCFYQMSGSSLQETVLHSIKDSSMIEPIEAALKSRDGIVQTVAKQAFETAKKRPWLDLLVVSFALSRSSEETGQQWDPLRVIVSGMGCQRVRENDSSVLNQMVDIWTDTMEEPLSCQHPHDLADLKIWHQALPRYETQELVVW